MADLETYRQCYSSPGKADPYARRFECGAHKRQNQREQAAVRKIFQSLPECRTVLDVPAGTGRFLATLAQNDRKVLAADASLEMLDYCRTQAKRDGLTVQFIQGDASKLPLAANSVDAGFSNRLLHHILEPSQRALFLQEFHRVSRRILVVSFFDYRAQGVARRVLKRLKGAKPMDERQPSQEQFARELSQADWAVRSGYLRNTRVGENMMLWIDCLPATVAEHSES